MAAIHRVDLRIEAKEDATSEGVQPQFPDTGELAATVADILADETKHHDGLGWRVTRADPAAAGTVLVSAADLRHVLDRVAQGRWLDYLPEGAAAAALREQLEEQE
jgi:hypothetical protein